MGLMVQFHNLVEDMAVAERDTLLTMLNKLSATIQGLRETADEYANADATSATEMDGIAPKAPEGGTRSGQGPN